MTYDTDLQREHVSYEQQCPT